MAGSGRELRLGVIGAGGRGQIAQFAHKPEDGVRIVACCDVNPQTLAECKEKYQQPFVTTDYRALLAEKPDAVFLCSPDFLHEEHALAALNAGCGVYLEKPMAITIEGADRILAAARANNAPLFVGHNMRYMGIIRKMKELIAKGAVGKVKSVWCRHFINYGGDAYFRDWHSERKNTTGLLLQKGAHDIDVIHWLAGAYSTRVSAFGNLAVYGDLPRRSPEEKGIARFNDQNWPPRACSGFSPVMDIEDQTVMIMQMENGILGSYLQCHFTPDGLRNYTVIGDEGRLENIGDAPDSPIMIYNKRHAYRVVGDEVYRGEESDGSSHGGADSQIVGEFVDFLRTGRPTTATPEAARMAVAAGYLATMSLRQGGGALDVPPLARA